MPVENQIQPEQIQVYVVYEGSVAWISSDRAQDGVCGYAGLTFGLNHLQTHTLPRQLNSLCVDLFGSHQWRVTGSWDFSPQRLMAEILPLHDLGMAGMMTSDIQTVSVLSFLSFLYWWLISQRIKKN